MKTRLYFPLHRSGFVPRAPRLSPTRDPNKCDPVALSFVSKNDTKQFSRRQFSDFTEIPPPPTHTRVSPGEKSKLPKTRARSVPLSHDTRRHDLIIAYVTRATPIRTLRGRRLRVTSACAADRRRDSRAAAVAARPVRSTRARAMVRGAANGKRTPPPRRGVK